MRVETELGKIQANEELMFFIECATRAYAQRLEGKGDEYQEESARIYRNITNAIHNKMLEEN